MSVKVAVRVRPFNKREEELKSKLCVEMNGNSTKIIPPAGVTSNAKTEYSFDNSFWSFDNFETQPDGYLKPINNKYADQKHVFETLGKPLLDNAWEGYHCCLFAYGQTGSGKSYSMIGYGSNKGIVPIACEEMFNRLTGKKAGEDYEVTVSMIEIYNEKIQDLLVDIKKRPDSGLQIRQNNILGVYVENATKTFVSDYKSIEALMDEGSKNRTIAATQMNATSSRAHTIISITFTQHQNVSGKKTSKISVLNLVDLAGSERQSKTGATGDRLKEAAGINLSLTTLGTVISALAEKEDSKKKDTFVPYRNSALTRILQNALGGNSKTCMICALSPAADNFEETLSTLRYADQAKKIKNVAVINETQTDKIIKGLKAQNERLLALLQEKERLFSQMQNGVPQQAQPQQPPTQPVQPAPVPQTHVEEPDKQALERQKKQQQRIRKEKQEYQKAQLQAKQKPKVVDQRQSPKKQEQPKQSPKKEEKKEEKKEQKKQIQQPKVIPPPGGNQIQNNLANGFSNMFNSQNNQPNQLNQPNQPNQPNQNIQSKALNGSTVDLQRKQSQQNKMTKDDIIRQRQYVEEMIRMLTLKPDQKLQQEQKTINRFSDLSKEIFNNAQNQNAHQDQGALYMSRFGLKSMFEQQSKNQSKQFLIPPFLENISKDIMTNRKIKIFLAKKSIMVGKVGSYPLADIVLSGRDVQPVHAEFVVQNGRVFLIPYNFKCLVYRNGKPVLSKIELRHLDRIVFGWNSLYLFKTIDDKNYNERIKDKEIDWDFYRQEMKEEQDIDQSDTETGGEACCLLF